MAAIDKKKLLSKRRLEKIFKMFDKDGSGTISSDEIKQMFGSNQHMDETFWNDLIK
jgi:calcium-dependent protein kinase